MPTPSSPARRPPSGRGGAGLSGCARAAARAAPAGFRGWQRTWLAVPEATSFVAGTCRAERFHADDRVLAEVVDGRGVAVAPGGRGMLVLTPLDLDAPLVRYATALGARMLP